MIIRRSLKTSGPSLFFLFAIFIATASKLTAGVIEGDNLGPYQVIKPISAVLIDGSGATTDVKSLVSDGLGLSTDNPLTAVHGTDSDTMLSASSIDGPVTVRFDLGQDFSLNDLWLWQYNGEDESDRGISRFDILFKNEDDEIVTQLIDQTIEQGTGDPTAPNYFCPFVDCARFIEIVMWDNYGDADWIGFSEIVFAGRSKPEIVPEPTGVAMILLFGSMHFLRQRRSTVLRKG